MSFFIKDSRLIKIIYYLGSSLLILTLLRISLWLLYQDDFSSLNSIETLQSFWMGLRVDLISVTTSTSILVLFLILPFRFSNNEYYQNIFAYLWYVVLIVIVFVILADMVYFDFVHRHVGSEIKVMGDEADMFVGMLLEYKIMLVLYAFFCVVIFFLFRRAIKIKLEVKKQSMAWRIGIFFIVFILLFLSIRGKIQGKPFSISDAFSVNKTASGNLALNGFYTLYRTISKNKKKQYRFYDDATTIEVSQSLLKSSRFEFLDQKYPLLRSLVKSETKSKKHNVVIIMLESWSSKYVDSFGSNNLGVTKNFDKIASKGLSFSNFYANGQRSIEGITALLTGIPVLKNFSFLGSGLELSNLSYLGTIAKENGYSTIAMQSSKRGSFNVDSITKLAGFDSYYGAEDMPLVGDEDKDKKPRFGTWDGNMYTLLHQKLSNQKEPFVSFAFTSTTHTPFISPGKQWERYKHNNTNLFGYLNTLKYADDKLGEFMEKVKNEPWFDNTIFIFMADHTIGFGNDSEMFKGTNIKIKNRELEEMKIPLVIYAPKIFKPAIIDSVGSQADIIPTLIDILNWKGNFATLSNSLISPSSNSFALFKSGETIGLVDKSGYIKHTLDKRLEMTGDESLEKRILSIYQLSFKLLQTNRWYKKD
ncbi:Phosphoglycerol transferase I [hydrothermal vent metagenome]|uniref:Phosphoglycerol transferase I n=1 Tax=hydrothermal vent metagenome TaxID=652676 RepID=A0A3B1E6H1_9ZZZZ